MNQLSTVRSMLRVNTATWAGAAWMVLQQFGIPVSTQPTRDDRIVRMEEAADLLREVETLPDGRVLTLSIDQPVGQKRQDTRDVPGFNMSPN